MLKVFPDIVSVKKWSMGAIESFVPTEALDDIESLWTPYDIGEHDGLGPDTWVGHMEQTML